jgi:outer membrane biosynthesis protein TonB
MLLGIISQLIELPIPERSELIEVPERVAKLIRELPEPTPPAPVAEPQPEEAPEPEAEPEPMLAEETPPEPVPVVVDEPAPQQQVQVQQESVREQAQTKGILAFRDSFASRAESRPSAQLGSQARLGNAGDSTIGRPERSMVTTMAPGSSGGINLASISRNVGGGGGGQIAGVQVSQVASSIGSGGGNADRPLAGGQGAGRTDEEIQIVFDRHKAALYRLYNRELRNDPTLRGQLVIRLTIEPDGSVSLCRLMSSDMEAPILAEQVIERIRGFDFGAKEGIVPMTIVYPIDFLPAA